jgi:hypothetical protein
MPLWGFIFVLAATIVFVVDFVMAKRLVVLGLALLAAGIIFTFATSSSPVHF